MSSIARVKCRLCEMMFPLLLRRCPGCYTPNQQFQGEPAVIIDVEVEPEVYRSIQVLCAEDSKTMPQVIVDAVEDYITKRRKKTS